MAAWLDAPKPTDTLNIGNRKIPVHVGEFWTPKQRQASTLHEVSYRACFKPQLPDFFIDRLTIEGDLVYDPFAGRGTTAVEAALHDRKVITNDVNPLNRIFTEPRLEVPDLRSIYDRLRTIQIVSGIKADLDLSMFFHPDTEAEIVSLRNYLIRRKAEASEDEVDRWIRMVATNRLTGHSKGFFSVYTLPPNQAASAENQTKINEKLDQIPEYRDTRRLIYEKSRQLQSSLTETERANLRRAAKTALYLMSSAVETKEITPSSVQLTVTSPPFLDVVQYADDNWLRCWFNNLDANEISQKITMCKKIEDWAGVMGRVFGELYRVTKRDGWVAFEVGEVRNGKVKLEEIVAPLGVDAGFECDAILINSQKFTKTANIWGVHNNRHGTNSNRIVLFSKV
ncbi:MAG: DNA modification methylase [Betaproteobacteria bacterium RIFCSPLOWO2_12_FULL_62_13]|nr:MAG: DNA modification methylase [Betaproteobacteria bacterium RIFCSPLOWO2_12_FULL_62_13]